MRRVLAVLPLVGAMVFPDVALAQSPAVEPLTATCQSLADNIDQATCLYVVNRFLDPAASPAPSAVYGTDLPGPGVMQVGSSVDVTLAKVDWKTKSSNQSSNQRMAIGSWP